MNTSNSLARIGLAVLGVLLLLPMPAHSQDRGKGPVVRAPRSVPNLVREPRRSDAAKESSAPASAEHGTQFPQRALSSDEEAEAVVEKWRAGQPAPAMPENPVATVKAEPLTPENLRLLVSLLGNPDAAAEMIRMKLEPEKLFGILFTVATTQEYIDAKQEFEKNPPRGDGDDGKVEWTSAQDAFVAALAAAGLRNAARVDLDAYASALTADAELHGKVSRLLRNARMEGEPVAAEAPPVPRATILPSVAAFDDRAGPATAIAKIPVVLCNKPLASGSYTQHYGSSWSFLISMNVPCGTHWVQTGNRWWKGHWAISYCGQVYTIAAVSFALDLGVGYSITCCGATAWGTASATTCGSIVGITKCAGCTATVAAVTGLTKVVVSSQCNYGLGVVATVTCKVGNYTVLAASWPFGWAVAGPCPPAAWPCP